MEIKIKTGSMDYVGLLRAAAPLIREGAEKSGSFALKTVSGILNMPGELPLRMLSALPQDIKDELAVYLVNHNREKVIGWIHDALKEKGFDIEICDVEISEG